MLVAATVCVPRPALSQDHPRPSLASCRTFVNNAAIGVRLLTLQAEHPDTVRAFAIGSSLGDRELWAALISADPDRETAEPEVRIIGGMHGDECMSVDIVLEIAEFLSAEYGADPEVTDIVDGAQILIVPSLNPDGRARLFASRTNSNDVDLNRNMGFAWVDVGGMFGEGPHPFSEPETMALRDISQHRNFVLGLSYHTQADVVNGPWNYTPRPPPDDELVATIGAAYAGDSGYVSRFGWDWYNIHGDVNDWSLGTHGTFDWTIELRDDLSMEWDLHRDSLLRFLAFASRGVRGVVTDTRTGEPLNARIQVNPETSQEAHVYTDSVVGDYHRILLDGIYTVMATAQGYEPLTVTDVVVEGDGVTELSFELAPLPNGALEYGFEINAMTLPEPILNEWYEDRDYLNTTLPSAALGPPDGLFYSMSPGGSLTVDLGEEHEVLDGEGEDLEIVSGSSTDDPVVVAIAADQDGPFVELGDGAGTFVVDLAGSDLLEARFVRLFDIGEGPFNDAEAGYDLDAVINLSPRPRPDVEPDGDADADMDGDLEIDADVPVDSGPHLDADLDAFRDSGPPHDADRFMPDAPIDAGDQDADVAVDLTRRERGCSCRTALLPNNANGGQPVVSMRIGRALLIF